MPAIKLTDVRIWATTLVAVAALLGVLGYNFEPAIAEKVRQNSTAIATAATSSRLHKKEYVKLRKAVNTMSILQAVEKQHAIDFEKQIYKDVEEIKKGQQRIINLLTGKPIHGSP